MRPASLPAALVTPPLDRGVLPGIVRDRLLGEARREILVDADGTSFEIREERIELEELVHARELFLTNTTGGVIPVRELRGIGGDRIALPGARGALTNELSRRIRALEERDRARLGT